MAQEQTISTYAVDMLLVLPESLLEVLGRGATLGAARSNLGTTGRVGLVVDDPFVGELSGEDNGPDKGCEGPMSPAAAVPQ